MLPREPLWYKDAIIYELHVRAFMDSNGDGIGDFRGLAEKLDYLADLGVTAIWLLPFYPSPLRDDGYDIADYHQVHPNYGNIRDFREVLRLAHERNLRVITELVINHTSDQHPWFQRARLAPPGSVERDFYVWSDTPDKFQEARIIFKDFERSNWTWDPVAQGYYWHRFYSHQPDLNYDNPAVWEAVVPTIDYWMNMGVDGMRLDAIPYLYEREGTNCENLPETHNFLKHLREHLDGRFEDRMLLGEANQWPEDAVAYFGDGDECHMAFHFPVMPRMFMALHMEDRYPIIETMRETPPIPENAQWCLFLRNHDELTLEMVTDEERDYMYRAYARDPRSRINLGIRRRLAPLLDNNRRRVELMNGLLFSLPGTPVIYYGDEIGMGDNIYLGDRNGVRTPMQWSGDRNAGFSRANPQRLYLPTIIDPEYHYEAINVEAQQNNPSSLLWWMKRLIAMRKQHKSFGRGSLHFLEPTNPKVLAFTRRFEDEVILVVANLSRFVQHVGLDLEEFHGMAPLELFGRSLFPAIGTHPYELTLGPHAFYWFSVVPAKAHMRLDHGPGGDREVPTLRVNRSCEELFPPSGKSPLDAILMDYLRSTGELTGPPSLLKSATYRESFSFRYGDSSTAYLVMVTVESRKGLPVTHLVPMTFLEANHATTAGDQPPAIAEVGRGGETIGHVIDALADPEFCSAVLHAVETEAHAPLPGGELLSHKLEAFSGHRGSPKEPLTPVLHEGEQANASVAYGNRLMLKLFRRVEEGVHPDLEIGRFLTERTQFRRMPPTLGYIEYRRQAGQPTTLGVMHGYVNHQGTAWRHTLGVLGSFYDAVVTMPAELLDEAGTAPPLMQPLPDTPAVVDELIGTYLETARELGRLTAEMHEALSGDSRLADFAPEPFGQLNQRSVYQSMRNLAGQVFTQLRTQKDELPEADRDLADRTAALEPQVVERFKRLLDRRVDGHRIRTHGHFNLRQLLNTGKDFVVIDFEGDPRKSISERRLKRLPLRDPAAMIESFYQAAHLPLYAPEADAEAEGVVRPEDRDAVSGWADCWSRWAAAVFLQEYLRGEGIDRLLPPRPEDRTLILEVLQLEQGLYTLGQELTHRPAWAGLAMRRVAGLLHDATE